MKKEDLKQGMYITDGNTILRVISWTNEHISTHMLPDLAYHCLAYEELDAYYPAHWTDGIKLWDDYKKQEHTVEEIFNTLEAFFSLDRDSELSKLMAYKFMDINCF